MLGFAPLAILPLASAPDQGPPLFVATTEERWLQRDRPVSWTQPER